MSSARLTVTFTAFGAEVQAASFEDIVRPKEAADRRNETVVCVTKAKRK